MKLNRIGSRHKEGGFTLIEMLIVLFIIGALLLVIIPNLTDSGVQAQQKACDANKQMIEAQAETYYLENNHQYPSVNDLVQSNYLKEIPRCPLKPEDTTAYSINEDGSVTCAYHDKSTNGE
ncbi:prepilin-type N-terminal cleavage/methylation domain-containing protein [Caldalkalibacillus uzonensis]|uniref:Prepilin-type N-terminal cleavage/methylation domain-containing protein n=1 Tax=Caldalkalibacillus uzonensis TaxID=353224 RepID=A0ABU0CMP9_9BACI|nr:competence type IV pilus major pilin ComGC [Caldalkalibacillus uzonensis]MDQ0337685.1 prepilin-type N-terminal cleavage/methylation domain-containing protein [Caldalkalibacillus uzonensis]